MKNTRETGLISPEKESRSNAGAQGVSLTPRQCGQLSQRTLICPAGRQNWRRKPRLISRVAGSPLRTRAMALMVPTVPALLMFALGTA